MKRIAALKSNLLGMTAIFCAAYLIGVTSAPVYQYLPRVEINPNAAMMAIAILICIYVAIRNAK